MNGQIGVKNVSEFVPEMLLAGDFPRVSIGIMLAAGQEYKAGSVIGVPATVSSGSVALSSGGMWTGPGNTDYPELVGVLVEDVDATAADVTGVVWASGEFALNRVILKDETNRSLLTSAALTRPIFFRNIELAS